MAILITPEKRPTTFGPVAGVGILLLIALILYVIYIIFISGSVSDDASLDPSLKSTEQFSSINISSVLENELFSSLKEHVTKIKPPITTSRANPFLK